MKCVIYWRTRDEESRIRICRRFGIQLGMTVNRETRADIRDEDAELFRETARRGYFEIRFKRKS